MVLMTLLLTIFVNDVLPIFVIGAVGFLLARHLHVEVKTLSRVIFNVLAPCLAFTLIATTEVSADEMWRLALFTIALVLAIGIVARLAAWPFGLSRPMLAAFLIVVMFSNAGNYGLSVILFAFGREALARAAIYFVVSAMMLYTVGVFIASLGRRTAWQALGGVARVPAVYAVAAAGLVLASGVTMPVAVMRPVGLLGDAAIPVMMLVLGMQFERGGWPERPGLVATAAALSLVVSPLLGFGLAYLLGIDGPARQAAMVESAMPSAVVTTILALEFDLASSFVTAAVVLTTVLSPITVTVLIAFLQRGG